MRKRSASRKSTYRCFPTRSAAPSSGDSCTKRAPVCGPTAGPPAMNTDFRAAQPRSNFRINAWTSGTQAMHGTLRESFPLRCLRGENLDRTETQHAHDDAALFAKDESLSRAAILVRCAEFCAALAALAGIGR